MTSNATHHEVIIDGAYVATVRDTGDVDYYSDGPAQRYYEIVEGGRHDLDTPLVVVAATPEAAVRLAARLGWVRLPSVEAPDAHLEAAYDDRY